MFKLFSLTKILFLNGISGFGTGKTSSIRNMVYVLIIIAALIPFISQFSNVVDLLYFNLEKVNQQYVLLSLGAVTASLTILIFGLFYVLNVFYYSKDLENLLPLPLKPHEISGAKFLVVLIYEYMTALILLGPLFIRYGVNSNSDISFYIIAFIIFLFIPVLPLTFSSFISMSIMSIPVVNNNKDKFKYIISGMMILIIVGINQFLNRTVNLHKSPEEIRSILSSGSYSLVDMVSKIFPGVNFASYALIKHSTLSGLLNLLAFAGINIVAFMLFLIVSEKLYFKGSIGYSEVVATKKIKSINLQYNKKSLLVALIKYNWDLLIKTPAFFFNCVLIIFLLPVFLTIFFNSGTQNQEIIAFIRNLELGPIIVPISLAMGIIITGLSATASTGISREGTLFFLNKHLPIKGFDLVLSKILTSFILNFIGVLLLTLTAAYFVKFNIMIVVFILLISIPGIIMSSVFGSLLDLYFPKLVWENEYKAVKQNVNVIVHMFLCFIFGGGIVYLMFYFNLNITLYSLLTLFAVIIINLILFYLLKQNSDDIISKIEI